MANKNQRIRAYNYGGMGSNLTKLIHVTWREADMIIWRPASLKFERIKNNVQNLVTVVTACFLFSVLLFFILSTVYRWINYQLCLSECRLKEQPASISSSLLSKSMVNTTTKCFWCKNVCQNEILISCQSFTSFNKTVRPPIGLARQLMSWQWKLQTLFCPRFGRQTAQT